MSGNLLMSSMGRIPTQMPFHYAGEGAGGKVKRDIQQHIGSPDTVSDD